MAVSLLTISPSPEHAVSASAIPGTAKEPTAMSTMDTVEELAAPTQSMMVMLPLGSFITLTPPSEWASMTPTMDNLLKATSIPKKPIVLTADDFTPPTSPACHDPSPSTSATVVVPKAMKDNK